MTLQVSDLRVYYRTLAGDVQALDGATFSIDDKEIMGLAGESGCGKSTLGNSLIRLDGRMKYVSGSVNLDGNSLPVWDNDGMNEFRFRDVSVIPQYAMSAMNPTRKIGKMIARAARVARRELQGDQARVDASHRSRGLAAGRAEPLPDRAFRRHEAAHGHGHLDAARPVAADRRRDHVGPRRLDSAGRGGDSRQLPRPRFRQEHDRDHPRRLDPLPDRRHDPDHVRRQAGREGADEDHHRRSATPLHEDADLVASGSRRSLRRTRSFPEFRGARPPC